MNAYPAELVNHHYACMFVAGLLPSQGASTSKAPNNLSNSSTSGADGNADPSLSQAQNPSIARRDSAGASTSGSSQQASSSSSSSPADIFPLLASDLCEIFRSRGRSTAWDPAQGQSAAFHTVLVDYNVRLPPRKTRPVARSLTGTTTDEQTGLANLPARSPLSPVHPSSPLFPDGIIAPIWLRKHRELVPAVYVAFFCLAEPRVESRTEDGAAPDHEAGAESPSRARVSAAAVQELKARDEELIRIISDRKRMLSERGIKMTVVLLTTRQMLESSALESRLSYIRRSSQLDSRASLFVLTPVSKAELADFVTSLQSALYDAALDYYREHYRRVRRKRTRYPPNATLVAQIIKGAGESRGSPIKDLPLSREGWMTRNSYKLGTFAEFSGNIDDAITNYAVAYNTLAYELLPSTMLLPPRTRRWAEAKVLADTLSMRLSRLHLCRGSGEEAWSQFRAHVKRFTELSQGWGIGETTFEFWSWLGKQYRLMGDLLDFAMRDMPGAPLPPFRPSVHFPPLPTFLLHPSHLPTPTASGNVVSSYNPQHGNLAVPSDTAIASGCQITTVCLGAGDCYYIAGLCALERWQRYKKMLWEERQQQQEHQRMVSGEAVEGEQDNWMSMNLAQERKVDHAAQAIDALTKAHDAFKREGRQRSSLFVASKIVNAYLDTEQHEVALRFLERIVKTYQAEAWSGPLLTQMLLAWTSAEQLHDRERQLRLLWTLLSSSALKSDAVRAEAISELQKLETGIAEPQTLSLEPGNALLSTEVVYAKSEVTLESRPVPFQIRITSPSSHSSQDVQFDSLHIDFGVEQSSLIIRHEIDPSKKSISSLGSIKIGGESSMEVGKANLSWSAGSVRALQGALVPASTGIIQVCRVSLHKAGAAPVVLHLDLSNDDEEGNTSSPRWLVSADPLRYIQLHAREHTGFVVVKQRQYKIKVDVEHHNVAYVDEAFSVRVTVANDDNLALACRLSVNVLGGKAMRTSTRDLDRTNEAVQDEPLGKVAPGSSQTTTVSIHFEHDTPQCQAEVLIHAFDEAFEPSGADASASFGSEYRIPVSLPVRRAFSSSYSAQWKQVVRSAVPSLPSAPDDDTVSLSSMTTAGDLQTVATSGDHSANKGAIASINAAVTVHAQDEIVIKCMRLVLNNSNRHLKLLGPVTAQASSESSNTKRQAQETAVEGTWQEGDRWGGSYDIEVLAENAVGAAIEGEDGSVDDTGHLEVEWTRHNKGAAGNEVESWNIARLALPLLLPPHLLSRLVISMPTIVGNEQAFVMLVTIVNPSKLPSDVLISIDDNHADFTVLSHKSFTVPNLLPRSTRSVPLHISSRTGAGLAAGSAGPTPTPSPRQSVSSRQERSGSPAPVLRVLPTVRAWQRDRREVLQLQQQQQGDGAPMSRTSSNQTVQRPPLINSRPGIGVPLNVLLRYTASTRAGGSSSSINAGMADPSIPARPLSASGSHDAGGGGDLAARLRSENERSGLWTVLVQG